MMEERYHVTKQNGFYPDMSNVNKNITVEAKLISPPTYKEFLMSTVHLPATSVALPLVVWPLTSEGCVFQLLSFFPFLRL